MGGVECVFGEVVGGFSGGFAESVEFGPVVSFVGVEFGGELGFDGEVVFCGHVGYVVFCCLVVEVCCGGFVGWWYEG